MSWVGVCCGGKQVRTREGREATSLETGHSLGSCIESRFWLYLDCGLGAYGGIWESGGDLYLEVWDEIAGEGE